MITKHSVAFSTKLIAVACFAMVIKHCFTNNNEGDKEEKGTIFFKISIIFLVITNKLCLDCFDDVCWFN